MEPLDQDVTQKEGWLSALPNPFLQRPNIRDIELDPDVFPVFDNESEVGSDEFSEPFDVSLLKRSAGAPKPLKGIKLLGAVFAELASQLADKLSTAELLYAAQRLIEVSKPDYVAPTYKDVAERPGYYSWDVFKAFESHSWRIAVMEDRRMRHCDFDDVSAETAQHARILQSSWDERVWEF